MEGTETISVTGTVTGGYSGTVTAATVTLTDNDTAPTSLALTVDPATVAEGDNATDITVTATLEGSSTLLTDTTVTLALGGQATQDTDYSATLSKVTIAAGASSGTATLRITPTEDTLVEGAETISVTGTAIGGYSGTVTAATVTLTDNDTAPTGLALTVDPATVAEGDSATDITVTATLEGGGTLLTDTTVTLALGGQATQDTDYTATLSKVTIAAGALSGTATLRITPTEDTLVEGTETISVTGTAVGGYSDAVTAATVTLTDNDTAPTSLALTVDPATVAEGDSATDITVTATLEGSGTLLTDTTVTLALGGQATQDTDYSATLPKVTIAAGALSGTATLRITPTEDTLVEGAETISVTGTATGGYSDTVIAATVTLTDNDTAPTGLALTVDPATVAEGDSVTDITVTATLEGGGTLLTATTVSLALGGQATQDTDYTATLSTVTIAAGATSGTATLRITPTEDTLVEGVETISVTGTANGGYSGTVTPATVTLTDNDEAPTGLALTVAPATVAEGDNATDITVTATLEGGGTLLTATTVTLALGGQATQDTDYTATLSTVTIAAGASSGTATLRITPTDDGLVEGDETISVTGTATGGYSGTVTEATVTLTDNDTPVLSIAADTTTVVEGAAATFTVTASPVPASELTVNVEVSQIGAVIAGTAPATLTVGTGGSGTLTVDTDDDSVNEVVGSITATLAASEDYTIATPPGDSASVTVTDNDTPVLSIATDTASVVEGAAATFTVTASPVPATALTVNVEVTQTGAVIAGSAPTTLTVDTGGSGTLTVDTDDDSVNEMSGSVTATLETGAGYTIATPPGDSASVTVTDNDTPVLSIAEGATTVVEGAAATFTVTASPAPASELTVNVGVTQTGAVIAGTAPATLTVGTGGSGTLTVDTDDDSVIEKEGSITATLAAGEGYTIAASPGDSASVTVTDNDTPVLSIEEDTASVVEGTAATFTVTASPVPAEELTVNVEVTQTGAVIAGSAPATLTVGTDGGGTLTVATDDDSVIEKEESITATLATGEGYTIAASPGDSASVTVTDNDTPVLSIAADTATVVEGAAATFTVTASPVPAAALTVKVDVNWTKDVIAGTAPTTLTVGIDGSSTLTVDTDDDSVNEKAGSTVAGSITVLLGVGRGYTIAASPGNRASVTVTDNDTPVLSIAADTASVVEGAAATFTVTASPAPASELTVGVEVSQTGAVIAGTAPTTLTVGTAGTGTLTVDTDDDSVNEVVGSIKATLAVWLEDYWIATPPANSATVTVTDNDTVGIVVTPTTGLATTEAGGEAIFTVVLTTQPAANVTIGVSSSDTSEGTVSPSTLTFTNTDWNTPKPVTLSGVDDYVDDGDQTYTIRLSAAVSADADYSGQDPDDITVSNTDNDTVGIVVTPTTGLATTEAGGEASFTVALTTQPAANVTVGVSSSDTSEGTVSPSALTFTNTDWNTPQPVTLTGVDDYVADGDQTYTIQLAAAVSADADYSGQDPDDVTVSNTDDDTVGIAVTPTMGLATTEAGGEAIFTVALTTQPAANVTIAVSSSDTGEGTVSPSALTFTNTDWKTPQQVTLTGVDDDVADGDQTYTIRLSAAVSVDADYSGQDPDDVTVSNADNETAAIVVTQTTGLTTTEAGGEAIFTVVLTTQPAADVTIDVSSSDTSEGAVSPSALTFTNVDWNTPKPVTLTGVDDAVDDGDQTYTIQLAAAVSTDADYSGQDPDDVTATNTDDDSTPTRITLTTSHASLSEAAGASSVTVTATLDGGVKLLTPTTVTLSLGGTAAVGGVDYSATLPSPPTVTIAAGTSSGGALLSITPEDDNLHEGDETISISGTAAGYTVASADIVLQDNDAAPTGIAFTVEYNNANNGAWQELRGWRDSSLLGQSAGWQAFVGEWYGTYGLRVTATLEGGALLPTNTEVTFSLSGTAALDDDYRMALPELNILAGTASGTALLSITPEDNNLYEPVSRNVIVSGAAAGGYTMASIPFLLVNITSNEVPPSVALRVVPDTLSEGDGATDVAVTATLVGNSRWPTTATVPLFLKGIATEGTDYTVTPLPELTIPAGMASGMATLSITPVDDHLAEGSEAITVNGTVLIGGLSSDRQVALARITLTDNDGVLVGWEYSGYGTKEDAGTVEICAVDSHRALSAGQTVRLNYATADDTALAGTDYTAASGQLQLTMAAPRACALISLTDNSAVNGGRAFTVSLTESGSQLGDGGSVTVGTAETRVTILEDDEAVTLGWEQLRYAAAEDAASVEICAAVLRGALQTQTTLDYAMQNPTGGFAGVAATTLSGRLDLAAGSASRACATLSLAHALAGQGGGFEVLLSLPSDVGSALVLSPELTAVAVADDVVVTWSRTIYGVGEGDGTARICAALSGNLQAGDAFTVAYASTDGSATAPDDYTAVAAGATLSFTGPAKSGHEQCAEVALQDDSTEESIEAFTLSLGAVTVSSGAITPRAAAPATTTVRIGDNDSALPVLRFRQAKATVYEGGIIPASIRLALTPPGALPTAEVDLIVETVSTAVAGTHYQSESLTARELTFETDGSGAFDIELLDDHDYEDQTLLLSLRSGTDFVADTALLELTLRDRDVQIGWETTHAEYSEGHGSPVKLCAVVRAGTMQGKFPALDMEPSLGGNAVVDQDYTYRLPGGRLPLSLRAATGRACVTVTILDDAAFELAETIELSLLTPFSIPFWRVSIEPAVMVMTINDNESLPANVNSVAWEQDIYWVQEEAGSVEFCASLEGALTTALQVGYRTVNGSARSGSDYTAANGVLQFDQDTTRACASLAVLDDLSPEDTEELTIEFASFPAGVVTSRQATQVRIYETGFPRLDTQLRADAGKRSTHIPVQLWVPGGQTRTLRYSVTGSNVTAQDGIRVAGMAWDANQSTLHSVLHFTASDSGELVSMEVPVQWGESVRSELSLRFEALSSALSPEREAHRVQFGLVEAVNVVYTESYSGTWGLTYKETIFIGGTQAALGGRIRLREGGGGEVCLAIGDTEIRAISIVILATGTVQPEDYWLSSRLLNLSPAQRRACVQFRVSEDEETEAASEEILRLSFISDVAQYYTLERGSRLPYTGVEIEAIISDAVNLCSEDAEIRQAVLSSLTDISDCADVGSTQYALIRNLDLSGLGLDRLPIEILEQMTALETLNLSGNPLGQENRILQVGRLFKRLSTLTLDSAHKMPASLEIVSNDSERGEAEILAAVCPSTGFSQLTVEVLSIFLARAEYNLPNTSDGNVVSRLSGDWLGFYSSSGSLYTEREARTIPPNSRMSLVFDAADVVSADAYVLRNEDSGCVELHQRLSLKEAVKSATLNLSMDWAACRPSCLVSRDMFAFSNDARGLSLTLDKLPSPSIEVTGDAVERLPEGSVAAFALVLDIASAAPLQVAYQLTGGVDTEDYTLLDATNNPLTGTALVIPARQTRVEYRLRAEQDENAEAAGESVRLSLVAGSGYILRGQRGNHEWTIVDDLACGRTAPLPEVLAAAAGRSSCGELTFADLAAVTTLDLRNRAIAALNADDLLELDNLRELDLRGNDLQSLPVGLLDPVQASLQTLHLDTSVVSRLSLQAKDRYQIFAAEFTRGHRTFNVRVDPPAPAELRLSVEVYVENRYQETKHIQIPAGQSQALFSTKIADSKAMELIILSGFSLPGLNLTDPADLVALHATDFRRTVELILDKAVLEEVGFFHSTQQRRSSTSIIEPLNQYYKRYSGAGSKPAFITYVVSRGENIPISVSIKETPPGEEFAFSLLTEQPGPATYAGLVGEDRERIAGLEQAQQGTDFQVESINDDRVWDADGILPLFRISTLRASDAAEVEVAYLRLQKDSGPARLEVLLSPVYERPHETSETENPSLEVSAAPLLQLIIVNINQSFPEVQARFFIDERGFAPDYITGGESTGALNKVRMDEGATLRITYKLLSPAQAPLTLPFMLDWNEISDKRAPEAGDFRVTLPRFNVGDTEADLVVEALEDADECKEQFAYYLPMAEEPYINNLSLRFEVLIDDDEADSEAACPYEDDQFWLLPEQRLDQPLPRPAPQESTVEAGTVDTVTVGWEQTAYSIGEGAGTVEACVNLTGSLQAGRSVEVSYETAADTALAGIDYTSATGTLTLAADTPRVCTRLAVLDDTLVEGAEVLELRLTGAEGDPAADVTATIDTPVAVVTVADDDMAPNGITLAVNPNTLSEGDNAQDVTVTATLDGGSTLLTDTEITLGLGGTAAGSGEDYSATVPTVTIAAGDSSGMATLRVTPTEDGVYEGNETIEVSGTATDYTVTAAMLTLTDNDRPPNITLTAEPSILFETLGADSPPVTVTATLDDGVTRPEAIVVALNLEGTAEGDGVDYRAVVPTVTITAQAVSGTATLSIAPTGDSLAEDRETIVVAGTAPGYTVTPVTLSLADDDVAGVVSVGWEYAAYGLTEDVGTAQACVYLSGSLRQAGHSVEVAYATADDTALSGKDYTALSGTLTLNNGTPSACVEVAVPDDTLVEGASKDFELRITSVEGDPAADVTVAIDTPVAVVTVADDDAPPTGITLAVNPDTLSEGDNAQDVTVTATLDGDSTLLTDTEITLGLGGAAAGSGEDYSATAPPVTITAGDSSGTATLRITPVEDDLVEGDETIEVSGTATDYTVTAAMLTLTDNDRPPNITLTAEPSILFETLGADSPPVTVTATLDDGVTRPEAIVVTLNLEGTAEGDGVDYRAVVPTITITAQAVSGTATLSIAPTGDSLAEGREAIVVAGTATGYTVTPVTLSLTDEDVVGVVSVGWEYAAYGLTEGVGTVQACVYLSGSLQQAGHSVEVAYATADDTALSGKDYMALSGTLTLNNGTPSACVEVAVPDDTLVEGTSKDFELRITSVQGDPAADVTVVIDTPVAVVTVADDDAPPTGITLTVQPPTLSEGDNAQDVTVTATLDGGSTLLTDTTVALGLGGAAAGSGEDYSATAPTVTITAGDSSGTATLQVTPVEDTLVEGDETIEVSGTATDYTVTAATLTLTDNDLAPTSITLTVQPPTLSEGDNAQDVTVTATLDGSSTLPTATTVTLSLGGAAAGSGEDYSATVPTVTITAGDSSGTATLRITPVEDDLVEGDETIEVSGTATDYTVTAAMLTLTDNDRAPNITLTAEPSILFETLGADSPPVTVTATLDDGVTRPEAIVVTLNLEGTAEGDGVDYRAVVPTVTITAQAVSGTATLSIAPTGDSLAEDRETIVVAGTATGYTVTPVTLSLTDDDVAGVVSVGWEYAAYGLTEDVGTVQACVYLSGSLRQAGHSVEVVYTTADDTALSGTDYTALSGTLTLNNGTPSACVEVAVPDDTLVEGAPKDFELRITSMEGDPAADVTVAIDTPVAVVTVTDDDIAPEDITLTAAPATLFESNGADSPPVTITATLGDGSVTLSGPIKVTLDLGGTAQLNTDYSNTSLPAVIIAAGAVSGTATLSLVPTNDLLEEGEENIVVRGTAAGYTVKPGGAHAD